MTEATTSKRVISIDALRGFDMFWIIGGDALFKALFTLIGTGWALSLKTQLDHTDWNGFTAYDLIFPMFRSAKGCRAGIHPKNSMGILFKGL